MTSADLVLRGGTVFTAAGRQPLDVHIKDGRILTLTPAGDGDAGATIDVSGLLVLPGFVDTHVHLMEPGDPSRETFEAGSAAAVRSGVTTIIEHTHGWPVTDAARLTEKRPPRRPFLGRLRAGRTRLDRQPRPHR